MISDINEALYKHHPPLVTDHMNTNIDAKICDTCTRNKTTSVLGLRLQCQVVQYWGQHVIDGGDDVVERLECEGLLTVAVIDALL